MPSITVEDYLKRIYLAQQRQPRRALVPMGELADDCGVTPGTATSMAKTLAEAKLVRYEPRGGLALNAGGRKLALQVLRRHRIVELFLVEALGLDWSEVHDEAEVLEHAVSDKVLEAMDEHLGYPEADPHGDPIPSAEGHQRRVETTNLADCEPDTSVQVVRVLDQDPAFLRFMDRQGLVPGAELAVIACNPVADAITVKPISGEAVTLGSAAAEKVGVTVLATAR